MTERDSSVAEEIVAADSTDSEETPLEEQADAEAERKSLLDKHAQQGRELKAEREARVKAEQKAEKLEKEREESQYEKMDEDQKAEYRKRKEYEGAQAPVVANLTNERFLLRTIAETEDPKITKALSALYWRSEDRGRFPDKETVEAFVEGLTPDDEEPDEEPKKSAKAPPKVTPTRGTRTIEVTAADEVKAIEQSLKVKDGKFSYGDLLAARSRAKAQQASANRG